MIPLMIESSLASLVIATLAIEKLNYRNHNACDRVASARAQESSTPWLMRSPAESGINLSPAYPMTLLEELQARILATSASSTRPAAVPGPAAKSQVTEELTAPAKNSESAAPDTNPDRSRAQDLAEQS